MNDNNINLKKTEHQERLALLGLAAERRKAAGTCPDDEQFALFLEAEPGSAEQRRFFDHLAACDFCRQKWLTLTEELEPSSGEKAGLHAVLARRGLLSLAGSACAVTVGVMLYLSIDYQPGSLDSDVPPVTEREIKAPAEQARRSAGGDSAVQLKEETAAEADTVVSEPAVKMTAKRLEQEMQQSAKPKTSPAPPQADPPANRFGANRVAAEQEGFSSDVGSVEEHRTFREFINAFLSLCENRHRAGSQTASPMDTVKQGRDLLGLEETMTLAQKELVKEIVQLLTGPEPVKDTELDRLCAEADSLAAETD